MEKKTKKTKGEDHVYRDERGEIINTYKEDLAEVISTKLGPLRNFLNMVVETDADDIGEVVYIALALLERAEEKTEEAAKYINENYGRVIIERAMYHQSIDPETMLGIVFEPSKGVTA